MINVFEWLQQTIAEREPVDHVHSAWFSDLPEPLRRVMVHILRYGQTDAGQLACALSVLETEADDVLQSLVRLGYLKQMRQEGPPQYAVALGKRHSRTVPQSIWQALSQEIKAS
jgi:hypothetical protein